MLEHRSLDFKGAALALLLSALWGANPVAIKLGLPDVAPLQMALLRFVVSAAAIGGEGLAPELVFSSLLVVIGIALTMAR